MPWAAGRPALDVTKSLAAAPNGLDRLTPIGLLRQSVQGSRLAVDPDTLLVREGPKAGSLGTCTPANFATLAQLGFGGPAHDARRIRCLDGRVFAEDTAPGASDIGALTLLDSDPFAARDTIDTAPWTWTILQPRPDQPPVSEVRFQGEQVALAAGRFAFDDYRALALPFSGTWHLVASDGLREHPAGRFGLLQGARPGFVDDPALVSTATSDRSPEGSEALLCLETKAGTVQYDVDGTPSAVDRCADWRGTDGFWSYRQGPVSGVEATGTASNGPVMRRNIAKGRFTDLVATGLPRVDAGGIKVPNALGVLTLTPSGTALDLASHSGATALFARLDGTYAAVTDNALHDLDGQPDPDDCPGIDAILTRLNNRVRIEAVERRGEHGLRIFGRDADQGPVRLSASCLHPEAISVFTETVSVATRTRHDALPADSAGSGFLGVQTNADAGGLTLTDGVDRQVAMKLDGDGAVLTLLGRNGGRNLVAVTEREAYLLDIDAALSLLAASPAQTTDVPEPVTEPQTEPARDPENRVGPSKPADPPVKPVEPQTSVESPPAAPQSAPPSPQIRPRSAPERAVEVLIDPRTLDRSAIRVLQTRLQRMGFYRITIDGLTGPGTDRAIRAYQQARGEAQTGLLTPSQAADLLGDPQ
ncbi:peptidoglycan-binding domain-containing protein [Tropicibacter oceani]|uniref:Peptidoglycan-binding domain-containing protein n=1 Tax=Tropicibacter oceani TaxID=3058420 RepID=A0ABY8QFQ6_9RHOB|nr:peptidoglycan-binding protein [Tropicibacter oceani]WGW02858.1 peptidoglycan-binding domain-containing protein [Tropicibacter oceani]